MKYPETARRLLEAMADAGLTQQQLSDKTLANGRECVSKSSISHYVNGANEPGHKAAYAMGNVLRVNPLWLMGLDVKKEPDKTTVTVELSDFEEQIIHAFRNSSTDIQAAVCAVLGIKGDIKLPRARYID